MGFSGTSIGAPRQVPLPAHRDTRSHPELPSSSTSEPCWFSLFSRTLNSSFKRTRIQLPQPFWVSGLLGCLSHLTVTVAAQYQPLHQMGKQPESTSCLRKAQNQPRHQNSELIKIGKKPSTKSQGLSNTTAKLKIPGMTRQQHRGIPPEYSTEKESGNLEEQMRKCEEAFQKTQQVINRNSRRRIERRAVAGASVNMRKEAHTSLTAEARPLGRKDFPRVSRGKTQIPATVQGSRAWQP